MNKLLYKLLEPTFRMVYHGDSTLFFYSVLKLSKAVLSYSSLAQFFYCPILLASINIHKTNKKKHLSSSVKNITGILHQRFVVDSAVIPYGDNVVINVVDGCQDSI